MKIRVRVTCAETGEEKYYEKELNDEETTRRREDYKIIKNIAKCRLCGDIIESKSLHDMKKCKCGEIAVDGGKEYLRRLAYNLDNIIELSVWERKVDSNAV